MRAWLYCGARVVCIDASRRFLPVPPLLQEGNVYTVSGIVNTQKGLGVQLKEIVIQPNDGFYPDRFRPISTINTDDQVSAMKRLMEKARQEKRVTVSA